MFELGADGLKSQTGSQDQMKWVSGLCFSESGFVLCFFVSGFMLIIFIGVCIYVLGVSA